MAVLFLTGIIYRVMTEGFQKVENQRVQRNIKRISAILDDRLTQINAKLADWTVWDDTYKFFSDRNQAYITSNLTQESFAASGIDEAIFVAKDGSLITSFLLKKYTEKEKDFPADIYEKFATGSALLKIDPVIGHQKGLIRTGDGLLFFVARNVVKSDGTGVPNGTVVFARYLNEDVLNSLRDLTQFEAGFSLWDNPNMLPDYLAVKNNFLSNGQTEQIKIQNSKIISGYLVIKDFFGVPQAIICSEIERDITLQGTEVKILLTWFLLAMVLFLSLSNYFLVTGLLLKKISHLSLEAEGLATSGQIVKRLTINKSNDEIDQLRLKINSMLNSLQTTQIAIESSNNHIVITDTEGKILFANKAAEKLTGYSRDQMLGQTPRLWGRQMSPEFYQRMWDIIKNQKQVFTGEVTNKRQNGENYIAQATISPVLDDHGTLTGFVAIEEDITERKQIEKTTQENLEKLEKLNNLMVGRELKMAELKKELALCQANKPQTV